jgi:hypothetical protein
VESIVSNCPELRVIVGTVKRLRAELQVEGGTESLRTNLRVYLSSMMKGNWLADGGVEQGNRSLGTAGDDRIPPVRQEWILRTTAAPVAKVDGLIQMAKEVVLDFDRTRIDLSDFDEPSSPRKSERGKDGCP